MGSAAAVIFLPAGGQRAQWQAECVAECRRRGWTVAGVASTVTGVAQMLGGGEAQRVVVARPEHRAALTTVVTVVAEVSQAEPGPHRTGRVPR